MTLEWDLIKETLEKIKENSNDKRLKNHCKILFDNGLIDSKVNEKFHEDADGDNDHEMIPINLSYKGLTPTGQEFLKGIQDKKNASKIKDILDTEGAKQDPDLIIKAIMKLLGL